MTELRNAHLAIPLPRLVGALPVLVGPGCLNGWLGRRDWSRIHEITAASQRQVELHRQLLEMKARIREERLPDEARERRRRDRDEQAEMTCEVRLRLGLPEEEPRG
jgi:hypothetical protein